jgi:hypothetical protein
MKMTDGGSLVIAKKKKATAAIKQLSVKAF